MSRHYICMIMRSNGFGYLGRTTIKQLFYPQTQFINRFWYLALLIKYLI